jgi:hypothetical protein
MTSLDQTICFAYTLFDKHYSLQAILSAGDEDICPMQIFRQVGICIKSRGSYDI